jgi:hypothetical protein
MRLFKKLGMRKIFDYLWFVLSIIGILYSLNLIYETSQPCYSDGCLIRLLAVPAIILFLFCAVACFFSFRNVKNYQIKNDDK